APSFKRPFRNWAPGPEVQAPVPLWEVRGNRCLQLVKRLSAVCSWMFPWPSLLRLVPSLSVVMPRPPLLYLPRRSTSRSCMLAGRTQGPFRTRQRMAGPWLPCTWCPSSGWTACPCQICHCLPHRSSRLGIEAYCPLSTTAMPCHERSAV
ncbi:hypothetical protein GOODEAATRI_009430, partial [Goodea atripinnis]